MNTEIKVHGLDGSLVEPDWAPLSPHEIDSVLSRYPELQGPYKIVSMSPRPLSAASVVASRSGRVFVKRHARLVRGAEGLREEHRFVAHLRAHGAPVPKVLICDSGDTVIEAGGWTYEVHAIPHGVDAYEDAISWTPFRSSEHARSVGETMARLHLAAEEYDAPVRQSRHLVAGFTIFAGENATRKLDEYVTVRPALQQYLAQTGCAHEAIDLLAPFYAELAPLLPSLQPLWTHNDLHGSNLFWSDEGPTAKATAVIDFGLCDRTNALHDLAHAIERSVVEWLSLVNDPANPESVPVHMDHLWALIEGYETVRSLSKAERAALAPMLALCHAEFALSETDYFLSVLHSREKAYMACEGYLVSHARWWCGPGEQVLKALRNWAAIKEPKREVHRG
ncbi:phosphotransferase enzyme family protein [Occallatibacter riparius]|uniref:Phosphotransferase n=1 Tax=Occallatibacter riparius TaxID=1002689 RepID=A0A9J7BQC8_9BACT|nr:phosphotransferase [Occallatibacter riparius]UWZ85084.1 phosphotransferase [Occallatibacter riparius]